LRLSFCTISNVPQSRTISTKLKTIRWMGDTRKCCQKKTTHKLPFTNCCEKTKYIL